MDLSDRIPEITKRIVETSQPEKIILFGSYARGNNDLNSDLDLLVIVPTSKHMHLREESWRMRRALRGLLAPVDLIVATSEQIQRLGNVNGLIYQTALQEGKVLYEFRR